MSDMKIAKKGDTVQVHYTGTLANGSQFDSSQGRDPLEFVVGAGMMIAGFDKAVDGMEMGAKTTVTIPCEEAYGSRNDALLQEIEKSSLPAEMRLEEGMQLQDVDDAGHPVLLTVKNVTETHITLDGNHALAGEDLTFDIELINIALSA